jgi:hypothetical protein
MFRRGAKLGASRSPGMRLTLDRGVAFEQNEHITFVIKPVPGSLESVPKPGRKRLKTLGRDGKMSNRKIHSTH